LADRWGTDSATLDWIYGAGPSGRGGMGKGEEWERREVGIFAPQ